MASTRRRFLKDSAAAVTAAGVFSAPAAELLRQTAPTKQLVSQQTLQAVGEVVLPSSELGKDGIGKVVAGFQTWLDGFEPVAELDHPYLSSSEIQYGPPDPRPRWQTQLEALELEAQKKYGSSFGALGPRERRQMIERAMRDDRLDRLPPTAEAHHVATGLLAYFYATPEATDLCYEAAIGRFGCQGLEAGAQKPSARSRR
jgi:hypothetical protein